jgi:hypothetical protein
MSENNRENLNFCQDLVKAAQTGEKKVKDMLVSIDPNTIGPQTIISTIEAFAHENKGFLGQNSYLDAFNKARARELYKGEFFSQAEVDKIYKPVSILNSDEKEVLQSEMEKFSQTANDTGTGLTQITSLVSTTLTAAMTKYFYDSPILQLCSTTTSTDNLEVRDITNDRSAEATGETTAITTDTTKDDTVVIDTISPKKVRIVDNKTISWLLNELGDPTLAGENFGRMERAIRRRMEALVFGTTGTDTDGANQFYAILNNKPNTGNNRGSLSVTVNGVGIGGSSANANHVDAINYVVGQLPLDGDVSVGQVTICCNYATKMKIMRTLDANNNYYFDMVTGATRSLASGIQIVVVSHLPNDLVVVADMSNVMIRVLRPPKLTTRIVDENYVRMTYDTYADGTIRFAYKATPNKNGFRHFTLQNNYLV